MDPWDPSKLRGSYAQRRIPRVNLPDPEKDEEAPVKPFEARVVRAREAGRSLGEKLLYTRSDDPVSVVLSNQESEQVLSDLESRNMSVERGKRFGLAAIVLHQALLEFQSRLTVALAKAGRWQKENLKRRAWRIRTRLQTMTQAVLTQAWAGVPRDVRQRIFLAFRNERDEIDRQWSQVCRGSLSATFVTRAFHGIPITSRSSQKVRYFRPRKLCESLVRTGEPPPSRETNSCSTVKAHCITAGHDDKRYQSCKVGSTDAKHTPKPKKWEVYAATTEEDLMSIDLIAVGRIAGLGRVGFCIQVKTGHEPWLEVMTQDPADTRVYNDDREKMRDRLWEATEQFKALYATQIQIRRRNINAKPPVKFFAAIIQTGSAVDGVTKIASNTKHVRALIVTMLAAFAEDLHMRRKRERDFRETDKPGIPLHPRKT